MTDQFFTQQQWKIFSEDLLQAFIRSGFEVVEEPYVDYALYGFRATYIRRYLLQRPTPYCEGILTTLLQVVGLPFGRQSQKMVILAAPRNMKNEQIAETLRLRIYVDDNGMCHVVNNEQQTHCYPEEDNSNSSNIKRFKGNQFNDTARDSQVGESSSDNHFAHDLTNYVAHIIETISPGLIQLPTEMKLEILKKLSVDSIVRVSQVNNEFRALIFQHGESLWRHLCMRDFNIRNINRAIHKTWMELYRESYMIHQVEICRKERALPGLPERPALPPAPYRLQIEWIPEVLELPFYPLHDNANDGFQMALEILPLRRADSLDSIQ